MAYEAGGEGVAGRLVDEQEVAHRAAGGIVRDGELGLGLDSDVGDVVHGDGLGIFHIGNAIKIQGAGDGGDAGLNQGRAVAQLEHLAGLNVLFGQAHNGGVEFAGGRGALGSGEEIAAGEIDVVGKQERDGVTGSGGVGGAGGAATVGCAAQMVGFAVMSFKENRTAGLLSQGLGTSMLQLPNIVRNPRIWIPPVLTAAILGPIATLVFGMQNVPTGSGMGTSGFVGQVGTLAAMGNGLEVWLKIGLLHFLLPALLCLLIAWPLRRIGWIKDGDLKVDAKI